MSDPNQTPPVRGGRAHGRRSPGRRPSGRGASPITEQYQPQALAPRPISGGVTISEIPQGGQFGVGGGPGSAGPGLGSGSVMVGTGGVAIGGAGVQRKRIRDGDGAGPSRPPVKDVLPPPPPPPPPQVPVVPVIDQQGLFFCTICRRHFDSDRGFCGHLRTHGDRGYRGAFPPPVFDRQEFIDEGVEHLLNPLPEVGDHAAGQGGQLVDPAAAELAAAANAGESGGQAAPNVEETAAGEAAAEPTLPDLNTSPPKDEHGNYI